MTHQRAFRFALQLVSASSGAEWSRLVAGAEADGYAVLSLPDHLGAQFAPLPALAAAAAVTSTIRLSMFVLANDLRHPGVLAKEVATLDVLSNGRVELGLGAGWARAEYESLGIPFESSATRIERLSEAVTIIRRLLAGESTSFAGRHYRVSDLVVEPRPVQSRVPIVLGGGAPKMLSLAGRLADIVSITTDNRGRSTPGLNGYRDARRRLGEQIGWVRDAAGERFDALELNVRVLGVAVDTDREAAARTLGASLESPASEILDSPFALTGTPVDIADHLSRLRDETGVSYFTVSQRYQVAMAPVVARLTGT